MEIARTQEHLGLGLKYCKTHRTITLPFKETAACCVMEALEMLLNCTHGDEKTCGCRDKAEALFPYLKGRCP